VAVFLAFPRRTIAVEHDEPPNPADIGFLGTRAVVERAQRYPNAIEQAWLAGGHQFGCLSGIRPAEGNHTAGSLTLLLI
jgi:hypothetical protein